MKERGKNWKVKENEENEKQEGIVENISDSKNKLPTREI